MAPARRTAKPAKGAAPPDLPPVRDRLLDAAMELVRAQGLQGFSQARVAAAAGLRQSHLTYYFPTRKDLLKALVKTIHAELTLAIGSLLSDDRPSPASLETVCEFFGSRLSHPLLARLVVALMNAADEDPSLRRWLVDLDNELIAQLGEIFDKVGLRADRDALTLLHASFIGIALMAAHDDSEDGPARTAHLIRLAIDNLVRSTAQPKRKPGRTPGRRKSGP
jgi:AcrR family transcriptional regulator